MRVNVLMTRKNKRRDTSQRSQLPPREFGYLVKRPETPRHEAIEAELTHARELADLEAVAEDDFSPAQLRWEEEFALKGTSLCEIARWVPEIDARACDCWCCESAREFGYDTFEPLNALEDLMSEPPLGAPVHPAALISA